LFKLFTIDTELATVPHAPPRLLKARCFAHLRQGPRLKPRLLVIAFTLNLTPQHLSRNLIAGAGCLPDVVATYANSIVQTERFTPEENDGHIGHHVVAKLGALSLCALIAIFAQHKYTGRHFQSSEASTVSLALIFVTTRKNPTLQHLRIAEHKSILQPSLAPFPRLLVLFVLITNVALPTMHHIDYISVRALNDTAYPYPYPMSRSPILGPPRYHLPSHQATKLH
jgi:hypothetical protein